MKKVLLTRDKFRELCLKRDGYQCVICGSKEDLVVHHIIERRLFPESHHYIENNGATVCPECHLKAEMTTISVEEIREACGIAPKDKVLPDHLYDEPMDKWGNPILPNGTRFQGELFNDPSVQKILEKGNVLSLFSKYVKYPRTYHLKFSESPTNDDRILDNHDAFIGKQVVVTYKLDGENTNMYNDHIHARSLDTRKHASRDWVRAFHRQFAHEIPEGWRICGENLYARHTIHYTQLDSYFYGFGIWNEKNFCMDWDEMLIWFEMLGIKPIPTFYEGIWDEDAIRKAYPGHFRGDPGEGFVVRLREGFHFRDFSKSCAKFVSAKFKNALNSSEESFKHWTQKTVIPNNLRGSLPTIGMLVIVHGDGVESPIKSIHDDEVILANTNEYQRPIKIRHTSPVREDENGWRSWGQWDDGLPPVFNLKEKA